jgi:hypothetical protein
VFVKISKTYALASWREKDPNPKRLGEMIVFLGFDGFNTKSKIENPK